MKGGGDRASHENVAVVAPFDLQRAAVNDDFGAAVCLAATMGIHERGACSRSAGHSQACSALPNAEADSFGIHDLDKANIGALGKQRITFEPRTRFKNGGAVQVRYKKGCVRVAHADRG